MFYQCHQTNQRYCSPMMFQSLHLKNNNFFGVAIGIDGISIYFLKYSYFLRIFKEGKNKNIYFLIGVINFSSSTREFKKYIFCQIQKNCQESFFVLSGGLAASVSVSKKVFFFRRAIYDINVRQLKKLIFFVSSCCLAALVSNS